MRNPDELRDIARWIEDDATDEDEAVREFASAVAQRIRERATEIGRAGHAVVRRRPHDERVLDALAVLGWPDDREQSAHIEDDGVEITPAGHYWSLVEDVLRAADQGGDIHA